MSDNSPDNILWDWDMPNSNTFDVKSIGDWVDKWMDKNDDGLWVDPFDGKYRGADITNDVNEDFDTDFNMRALKFLKKFDENEINGGVIFDPPYSQRQIKEQYERAGLEVTQEDTKSNTWSDWRDEVERICDEGAIVLYFGWDSNGIGITRGFDKKELLVVAHGGSHNDTKCLAEKKIN